MTAPADDATAAPTSEPMAPPSRRPPLPLIFAVTMSGILANTLLNAPLPDILEDFGVADERAGILVASASVPGIVMAPIIGLLADRHGRRRVLDGRP